MVLTLHTHFRIMRKRTIIFVSIILMAIQTAMGQIIYTQEDQGTHLREGGSTPDFNVMVPLQNVNMDQFKTSSIPLSDGVLLLVGLGGAYLLKKKRNKK